MNYQQNPNQNGGAPQLNGNANPNKNMTRLLWGIGIALVVLLTLGSGCSSYNKMVTLDEGVNKAWSDVEVQYQRRYDLIPNLEAVVERYAEYEGSTLIKVTEARAGLNKALEDAQSHSLKEAPSADEFQNISRTQSELDKAFNIYVNAVKEAYPKLEANENFKDLQVQLEATENRIANVRSTFVDAVNNYNVTIKRFPAKIWASIFGFNPRDQYKADQQAAEAPKVMRK